MMKKFRKWRDNLTVPQVHRIMRIAGIITEIIVTLSMILNPDQITKNTEKPIWFICFIWFILSLFMVFAIEQILYLVLRGMEKELDLKMKEEEK